MQDIYKAFITGGIFISFITLISWWCLFRKADYPGWYALIPFLNIYIFCKMTVGSGWFCFIMLIPFLNIFALLYILFRLSIVFGHGILLTLGLIVFYPLFILILAFGSSRYLGTAANL